MKTDSQLQRDVMKELEWEPRIDAAHIGVAAQDGVITLSGSVPSYWGKYEAVKAAKRVYGVKAVVDEIEVKLPGSSERTDTDIAEAVVRALRTNHSVPDDRIKVTVRESWVTLEGEVEWQYQRIAAENAVRYLIGVKGVRNRIIVKPHVTPTDVKMKIEDAFKRSAEMDARRILVEVSEGKVTLRGSVRPGCPLGLLALRHDRTLPRRVTLPPSTSTVIRRASISALRFSASSILSLMSVGVTRGLIVMRLLTPFTPARYRTILLVSDGKRQRCNRTVARRQQAAIEEL